MDKPAEFRGAKDGLCKDVASCNVFAPQIVSQDISNSQSHRLKDMVAMSHQHTSNGHKSHGDLCISISCPPPLSSSGDGPSLRGTVQQVAATRQSRRVKSPQKWPWSPSDAGNPRRHTRTTTIITEVPKMRNINRHPFTTLASQTRQSSVTA